MGQFENTYKFSAYYFNMRKGSKQTEEQRRRNREIQKKVWANPELRERHSQIHKGKHSSPKTEFKKSDRRSF